MIVKFVLFVCTYIMLYVFCLQADKEAEKDKVIDYNFILSICFFILSYFDQGCATEFVYSAKLKGL